MRLDPACRKITADESLAMDFGTDRRFELSLERVGPTSRHDQMFSGERGLPITAMGLVIPHADTFAAE